MRRTWLLPGFCLVVGLVMADTQAPALQVWNQSVLRRVQVTDFAKPHEPLQPISLVGVRNGRFSGQVVVGSRAPIKGLRVTARDLQSSSGGAVIPGSAVQIRYALPDDQTAADALRKDWSQKIPPFFGGLSPSAPTEVPVVKGAAGAVQPIWMTVHVPPDAQPGDYAGTLTISAGGAGPIEVPLTIKVHDWTLPDPGNFATHVGLVESPESVALHYNVAPWSEDHWQRMEKSFELMGQVGAKDLYIPLIRRLPWGNEQSMVHWIKKPGSGVRGQASGRGDPAPGTRNLGPAADAHDFSIVERYLDLGVKHLGRIPVVCLYLWAPFTGSKYMDPKYGHKPNLPLPITARDPATGRLEEAEGPRWGTPEVRPFWKPVIDGIRDRLAARGLAESMMVGITQDNIPNQDAVDDLKAVAPNAAWVALTHSRYDTVRGQPVGYRASVWGLMMAPDPASGRRYHGWMVPHRVAVFPRYGSGVIGHSLGDHTSLVVYRLATEAALTGGYGRGDDVWRRIGGRAGDLRGIGMIGVDFWPVISDRRGRRTNLLTRYPASRSLPNVGQSVTALLAPGKAGAIATVRFEMFREGLQESEARIFIEKALIDPALRPRLLKGLAERCQAVLDERILALRTGLPPYRGGSGGRETEPACLQFIKSAWPQRTDRLYAAAAAVGRALGTGAKPRGGAPG